MDHFHLYGSLCLYPYRIHFLQLTSYLGRGSLDSRMATGDGGVASAPSGGGYFDKKGEINELRQLLRQTLMEKNDEKRREAIKKVIAYMTLGIDVSKLFSDVVMASHTQDLVLVSTFLANGCRR